MYNGKIKIENTKRTDLNNTTIKATTGSSFNGPVIILLDELLVTHCNISGYFRLESKALNLTFFIIYNVVEVYTSFIITSDIRTIRL
jgi:hypothetical protein